MRQFRSVGQGSIDMVYAKGGIAGQDLILGGTFGKNVEYHRHGNSGSRCTDLTAADLWAAAKELLPRRHVSSLRRCRPDVQSMPYLDCPSSLSIPPDERVLLGHEFFVQRVLGFGRSY